MTLSERFFSLPVLIWKTPEKFLSVMNFPRLLGSVTVAKGVQPYD